MIIPDGRIHISRAEMLDLHAKQMNQNLEETKDYLMHHGIMGMKWGVRRYQPYYPRDGQKNKGKYAGEMARKANAAKSAKSSDKELTKGQKRVMASKAVVKAAKKGQTKTKVVDKLVRNQISGKVSMNRTDLARITESSKRSLNQAKKVQAAKRQLQIDKAAAKDKTKKVEKLQSKHARQDAKQKAYESFLKDSQDAKRAVVKTSIEQSVAKRSAKLASKTAKAAIKGKEVKVAKLKAKEATNQAAGKSAMALKDAAQLRDFTATRNPFTAVRKQTKMGLQSEQVRQAQRTTKTVNSAIKARAAAAKAQRNVAITKQNVKTQKSIDKLKSQKSSLSQKQKAAKTSGNEKRVAKLSNEMKSVQDAIKNLETKKKKNKP